jgi:hypothetical protein
MDRTEALRMYRVARADLVDTDAKLADLNRHRSGLQKVIEGLEEVYPELARGESWDETPEVTPPEPERPEPIPEPIPERPEPTPEEATPEEATPEHPAAEPSPANGLPPRGKGAVIAVLSEQPSRWFTTQDVLAAMAEHGWGPASEDRGRALRAVTNAIGRAVDDGKVQRKQIDRRAMKYRYRSPGQPAEVSRHVT